MIDYHMHTPLCHHAEGTPAEYLAVARQKGLREIGFSDHYPLGLLGISPPNKVSMDPEELPGYIEEIRALGAGEKEIKVKLGVEVDYIPGKEKETARLLAGAPFDFVIGSVHLIDDWDFTHPRHARRYETADLSQIYRRYFELIRQACTRRNNTDNGMLAVVKTTGTTACTQSRWSHIFYPEVAVGFSAPAPVNVKIILIVVAIRYPGVAA